MLAVTPAHALPLQQDAQVWLIEKLWTQQAVGIIGGEPKCCKSFFNTFPVHQTGRVLLYAAEDALHVVHQRLLGICAPLRLDLKSLDIQVITEPALRLDIQNDPRRLHLTMQALKPILLILDPFVRLHAGDENSAAHIAPILQTLRQLQRAHHAAVMLVHHSKKTSTPVRPGQSLRGSSEFHAWGDANLFIKREKNNLLALAAEHRQAPSIDYIPLVLNTATGAPFLACPIKTLHPTHNLPR
jgi:hypothetical protein